VIEIDNLTVRFGGVTPIDGMSVVFESGTCGLIGPNGAGKTTFFNVMSGFVKPAAGTITAFGENLLKMADYRRARWGLRRTFQTEMAIEQLTVFDNVAMIHEHSSAKRATRRRLLPQPRRPPGAGPRVPLRPVDLLRRGPERADRPRLRLRPGPDQAERPRLGRLSA